MNTSSRRTLLVIGAAYVMWAGWFIFHSSFIGIDGQRYFALFDDAMISMRYADNFAHGNGLVWNAGERVEGITNLLMTFFMSASAFMFDKQLAVLVVQLSGVLFVLASAVLTVLIAQRVLAADGKSATSLQFAIFIGVLSYYPLSFWTLMGMETGLLTFFLLASIYVVLRDGESPKIILSLPLLLGLAYLTRPDAVIPASIILGYRIYQVIKNRQTYSIVFFEMLMLASLIAMQLAFRFNYYGEMVPNTYTLKMTGMPIDLRIMNGLGFITRALASLILLVCLAVYGLIKSKKNDRRLLLVVLVIAGIVYQVWVGGDPWPYWRMIVPFAPLLLILAMDGAYQFNVRFHGANCENSHPKVSMGIFIAAVLFANARFLPEQLFLKSIYQVEDARRNVDTAIALKEIVEPDASVAVFFAGALPYYTGLGAIDILGKCDKWIASLPPDISGAVSWSGMKSVPGHNKYDLNYSIVAKQPTFVESFSWGKQDISSYGHEHYVQVTYKGMQMWLRRDSPDVRWEKLAAQFIKSAP